MVKVCQCDGKKIKVSEIYFLHLLKRLRKYNLNVIHTINVRRLALLRSSSRTDFSNEPSVGTPLPSDRSSLRHSSCLYIINTMITVARPCVLREHKQLIRKSYKEDNNKERGPFL